MLFALLVVHAVCGLVAHVFADRLGRRALVLGVVGPLGVIGWAMAHAGRILDGEIIEEQLEWVPALGLTIDLRVDSFTLLMIVLVSGIGALVYGYAWSYFGSSDLAGRVAGLLTLFAGSMLGVVLSDNLLFLFVCWELTSVTSYLLIGADDTKPEARAAALQALLITGFGGLAMLGGFVLVGQQAGTFRLSEILADPPSGTIVEVALVLVLIGAFTKSAQYPFHSWLPGAMVAPTPISAYLHSAAMVKAGIYLVARFAPAFGDVGLWRPLVVAVGLTTMIAGGLRALRPYDLKQLLAFGTISQLGFLMVLFGIGQPEATAAGCALILAHGVFKAALFMVVGIVDHETHTRDIRQLPTLGRGWKPTKVVAVAGAASMAAVPPTAGFIAKEEAYAAFIDGAFGDRLVLAGIVTGSVLTVAYSLRFVAAMLRPDSVSELVPAAGVNGSGDGLPQRPLANHSPSRSFLVPAGILAAASIVFGVVPALWSELVDTAANALDGEARIDLALWHGFTPALALSMATLGTGLAVFGARRNVAVLQRLLAPRWSSNVAYDAIVSSVLSFAARVTSIVQPGSLPIYAAVILVTAAVAPMVAMITGGAWWPGWPDLVSSPAQVPIAALIIVAGIAATIATRRFAAAILLGIVGYGMAMLFMLQGAPDLALTQFTIETLSVVVFLVVLRWLPRRFKSGPQAMGQLPRIAVSAMVGVFVVVMAVASSGARTAPPVSTEMSAQALPEGDGRNIVNVILVDIRGMDTLGEIVVLVAAGIGITALARVGMNPRVRRPQQSRRTWRGRTSHGGADPGVTP